MKKKIMSFLLSGLLFATAVYATDFAPNNTTIYFDLDKVVLAKTVSTKKALGKHKGLVAKHAFNLPLIIKAIRLWKDGKTTTTAYKKMVKKHPELVKIIEEISLTKELIPETAAIIKKLHKQGYTLGVASNMAEEDFKFYQEKYPEVFSCFSVIKVVPDKKHASKKPHKKYFCELLDLHKKSCPNNALVVFIDDKERNVKAAKKTGITSIQFCCGAQLESELRSKGILV